MVIKYNRTSTNSQEGNRFQEDQTKYDLVLFDKGVSGSVEFRNRPKGQHLLNLVQEGKVTKVVFEDLSRSGRNTVDVITTLRFLDENEVNVEVRNIGLQSRPNGKKNPIWNMITSVMSSIYELERENILERTSMGRKVFVNNGGKLGRPNGSNENDREFLRKEKSQLILKYLRKEKYSMREIVKLTNSSLQTVSKVKKVGQRVGEIPDNPTEG